MTGTINDIVNEEHKAPETLEFWEIEIKYRNAKDYFMQTIKDMKSISEQDKALKNYVDMGNAYYQAQQRKAKEERKRLGV